MLILSLHLQLGFPNALFTSGFPIETLYAPLLSPVRATCTAHLIVTNFYNPNNILCVVQSIKPLLDTKISHTLWCHVQDKKLSHLRAVEASDLKLYTTHFSWYCVIGIKFLLSSYPVHCLRSKDHLPIPSDPQSKLTQEVTRVLSIRSIRNITYAVRIWVVQHLI
jgi:hypothetical protein